MVREIVTVDMDDTIIRTSHDYDESAKQFGEFMSRNYGVDEDKAVEVLNEIDYSLLEEEGLSYDRYPKSFVLALQELTENPSQEHIDTVEQIGYGTFKSAEEYAKRGFMPGVEDMLNNLQERTNRLELVTVGDPVVQEPKIEGLNLHNWFDDVHIPSYEQGKSTVFESIMSQMGTDSFIHIGNSASSDIEASLSVGGEAVYISDDIDWLSDSTQHSELQNHPRVYSYNTADEFVPEIPEISQFAR